MEPKPQYVIFRVLVIIGPADSWNVRPILIKVGQNDVVVWHNLPNIKRVQFLTQGHMVSVTMIVQQILAKSVNLKKNPCFFKLPYSLFYINGKITYNIYCICLQ